MALPGAVKLMMAEFTPAVAARPVGVPGGVVTCSTLLSTAPVQSLWHDARASRLNQVVCVKDPGS